jgi:Cu(I)/Ag(I) efflux system membrane fusion protein/cobalt-zinc-cadmium efflux system membrane fusion protein
MFKKVIKYGVLILLSVLVTLFWSSYRADTKTTNEPDHTHELAAGSEPAENEGQKEKKIKYWVAPMDPKYIRNEPGKSPMGMDLVPVYEDEDDTSSEGVIRIDPVTVQTIGVRTAPVSRGQLHKTIRAVGRVTYDENLVEHIHTKISGWVETLYVRTTGEEVTSGQDLLSIYSPDLVATQEEYLQALKYMESTLSSSFTEIAESGRSLVEAAKKKLQFMDIEDAQIEALEKNREVRKNMTIRSSRDGIVIHKNVVDGMKVSPMTELYTIADLSKVWVIASLYEYEVPFLETGQEVEMTLSYDPGTSYRGKVTFIYPFLSNKTRTAEVRIEFDNPHLKLKPDMYVDVLIHARPTRSELLVPTEAVIRTGSRNVVITSLGKGKFLPKDVTVGLEGGGLVQIIDGITEEEVVVTSGQFLIDSESNLKEAINKMLEASAGGPAEEDITEEADTKADAETSAPSIVLSDDQRDIVSELLDHYLKVHSALVSESAMDVAAKTHEMHSVLEKLKTSDSEGSLTAFTDAMDLSMEGLHSGDLDTARTSFKSLSRTMSELIKGGVRDEAIAEDIKIYVCPMENEPWIQKGGELRNPYLGESMWICGVEEKY